MTPQERQLIDDLFDRLSKLETAPRDGEAMSAIIEGLRKAPNAVYGLVQTALVQNEALKRANDHIQELEAARPPGQNQSGSFLDSMRGEVSGQNQPRGSVPNVRAPDMDSRPVWNSGQVMPQAQPPGQYGRPPGQFGPPPGQYGQPPGPGQYGQPPGYGQPYGAPQPPLGGGGSSFLGTAAAAAAGAVGGSLLLGGMRSMMGGGTHQSFAEGLGGLTGDRSGSDLSRDAGINDVGSSDKRADDGHDSGAGSYDQASNDQVSNDDNDNDHDSDGFDDDSDGFGDDGGDDYA